LDDVTVTLQAGAALRLRLVDSEQHPVTELTLQLYSESDAAVDRTAEHQVVTTEEDEIERDEKGFLTARRLRPGTFTVRLEPQDWMGLRREGVVLVEGETTDLGTLTVERGSTVTGRVVDADDDPVGEAEIVLRWSDFRGSHSKPAKSDEDGTFSVAGLPGHSVTLTASAAGFADRELEGVRVDGDAIVVELARLGSIAGRVVDEDGGAPPVFSVRAVQDRSARKPPFRRDGTNGSFEIDRLAPGTYSVLIRVPGNSMARVDGIKVRAGATTDAGEIVLARGLRLEGRVVRDDNGAACPGAVIRIDRGSGPASWSGQTSDAMTVSDVRGRFSLDALEAGRYVLTVDHPEFAPLQRSVDLEAETATTDRELRLGNGGEIRGTVVDAEGLPLAGVDIFMFRGMRGYDRRVVATDEDGSFRFPRVAPGSRVLMRSRSRTGFNSQIKTVEVRDGETAVVNF
jgi:hypothetical protein